MPNYKLIGVFTFSMLLFFTTSGQILINEVCWKNGTGLKDEDGKATDWIELYNQSNNTINLNNYCITDGKTKWLFPSLNFVSKGLIVLYASDKDRRGTLLHTNFKLSDGEAVSVTDNNGNLMDAITLTNIHTDHSYGRSSDGDLSWKYFEVPTPDISNNNSIAYDGYVSNPVFSIKSGFYNGQQTLVLSHADPNVTITYTTDGSLPNVGSSTYTSPININKPTVVRAIAWLAPFKLPSAIVTNTYLIDYATNLPIISISTDPDNLWDWQKGICVMGPNADTYYPYWNANFWNDWEIPIHLEYFDVNKKLAFEQDLGCKIHGGTQNRSKPMKSFRILAKKNMVRQKSNISCLTISPIKAMIVLYCEMAHLILIGRR